MDISSASPTEDAAAAESQVEYDLGSGITCAQAPYHETEA